MHLDQIRSPHRSPYHYLICGSLTLLAVIFSRAGTTGAHDDSATSGDKIDAITIDK